MTESSTNTAATRELRPRKGLLGMWDNLAGPSAMREENALNLAWMLLFTFGVVAYALVALEWNALQLTVVALLALDLAGGVSVNASPSARKWWHRPAQGFRDHLSFVALHIVHLFALALLFTDFSLYTAALLYGYLLAASLIILAAPRDLQRPIAFIAYTLALLLTFYIVSVPAGLEWFAPFYYLKLLVAHLPADPR